MTGDGINTAAYDAENRLTQVSSGTATYLYDSEGNRVRKNASGVSTEYVYFGGNAIAERNPSASNWTDYIFFKGKRVARRDPSGAVHYYLSDHLGSTTMVVSAAGAIENESDYYPWGGELKISAADAGNHYKFTGKERDPESGLDYFGARYYGNGLGRFTSPDPKPKSAHPFDPQTWNRYAYVTNRPLIFIDPDGKEKFLVIYVQQPTPGTRQRNAGVEVGHAFIGLRDTKTHKEVRVGFYPKGGIQTSIAAAQGESVSGTVKNNDQHTFNIEKDYKLTDKQFQAVVDSVKTDAKNPPDFNLYNYNCTDWVIEKAAVAGIKLPSNTGGQENPNNPADLGQDLSWRGASPMLWEGPDSGSSDTEDPQKTNDLTPLFQLPSSDQQPSNATKKDPPQ
jgi:RHS repeat-associated protein